MRTDQENWRASLTHQSILNMLPHGAMSTISTSVASILHSKAPLTYIPASLITHQIALRAMTKPGSNGDEADKATPSNPLNLPPRARSVIYMGAAMALHFGGYEFFRNSCLALFTSSDFGFQSPAAFPLANALISPFSLILLWIYGQQLDAHGPRTALWSTTLGSTFAIGAAAALLKFCRFAEVPHIFSQIVIGLTFLFQYSYSYLLYTQQWSFVASILTPEEGSRWFASLAGFSSLFSSFIGTIIPPLQAKTGLLGLMATTCVTLIACLLCSDRAYALSQENGFDPAEQIQAKKASKEKSKEENQGQWQKSVALFRREPTLLALLLEVLAFQSLNTILNVAFVRALKSAIPNDMERSAYTGRFYSIVNGLSAILQFFIVPLFMKFAEPRWIWRLMPTIPLAICIINLTHSSPSLTLAAAAMLTSKTMDYALRSVVGVMAYQPLDFESRFLGKEIIGVFGSRFGKSGMSMILSGLTALGWTSLTGLGRLSLGAVGLWFSSTMWLSRYIPTQKEAEALVESSKQDTKKNNKKEN